MLMIRNLLSTLFSGPVTMTGPAPEDADVQALGQQLEKSIKARFGRSLAMRGVDAGSCNACELEIHALNNAVYDMSRFGLHVVASPRHADIMLVTGPVSLNMKQAVLKTWEAMPAPKWLVAVGDCPAGCGVFAGSYAVVPGGVSALLPVDLHIPGCPPKPIDLLKGLLALVDGVDQRQQVDQNALRA
jgi:Ni,Fe-hydrogenase III small subunit